MGRRQQLGTEPGPVAGDTALVTNAGTYTIMLGETAILASLELGGNSGTQTLAMTNTTGGNVLADEQARISLGGVLRMEGGYLSAFITVTNGGQLEFAGDATKYLYGMKINNAGTVVWSGNGDLTAAFDGNPALQHVFITNLAGGTFEITGDGRFNHNNSIWELGYGFYNHGTLRKTGGTGETSFGGTPYLQLDFQNTGNIVVEQGSLVFSNGFVSSGTFDLATNTAARLDGGTFELRPGSLATGLGQLLITNGSVTLTGTVPSLTWSSGFVRGTFTVATDATFNVTGDATKYLYGTKLNNAGTVRWTGAGNLIATFGGDTNLIDVLITNQPGALFDIATDATLDFADSIWAQSFVFHNAGTLRKSAGAGATILGAHAPYPGGLLDFQNAGAVEVQRGALCFSNAFTQAGGTLWFGVTDATNYGRLHVAGLATLNGIIRAAPTNAAALAAGDHLQVLTCGSCNRGPVVFAGRNLGGGLVYDAEWSATALTLAVRAADHPARPALSLSYASTLPAFVLVEGPAAANYRFDVSDDLTGWTAQATNSSPDGVWEFCDTDAANSPMRFYRVAQIHP